MSIFYGFMVMQKYSRFLFVFIYRWAGVGVGALSGDILYSSVIRTKGYLNLQ